ncbi:MAG: OmpA family protein, partial [Cyclobacteriaceae bacterium]|nr:OmpA family protein [Cyclobacteriaceae bacterium]
MSTNILIAQNVLVSSLNTPYDESNMVLSPDGKTLYFTVGNHIDNKAGRKDKGDIWYSKLSDSKAWGTPLLVEGSVNSIYNDRMIGFSPDGLVMYLHDQYAADGRKVNSKGISMSSWSGKGWSKPVNIDIPYFNNSSPAQSGYISPDGEILLLSLDSYKSIGNEDLYICFKNGTTWTEPKNLGPAINTPYQEFTPYLSDDKNVLFFASNGRGGLGSTDIFYSKRLDHTWTNWSVPQNMGPKVNSAGRDTNFILVSSVGKMLVISARNSNEYGDIISLDPFDNIDTLFSELIPPVDVVVVQEEEKLANHLLSCQVKNQNSGAIANVTINIIGDKGTFTILTGADGSVEQELAPNSEYTIKVNAPHYMPLERDIITDADPARIVMEFMLTEVREGVTVNLNNVLFKQGTTSMIGNSKRELDLVVEMLKENPSMEIFLSGHTDNRGDPAKNVKLSKQRVNEIRKYLISKGIKGSRVSGKGFGGAQ